MSEVTVEDDAAPGSGHGRAARLGLVDQAALTVGVGLVAHRGRCGLGSRRCPRDRRTQRRTRQPLGRDLGLHAVGDSARGDVGSHTLCD